MSTATTQAQVLALQSIVAMDDSALVQQVSFVCSILTAHRLLNSQLEQQNATAAALFNKFVFTCLFVSSMT